MTDCILHIGLEKTGSTSLQATLSANRDALLWSGLLYPRSLGDVSHTRLYAYASESGLDEIKTMAGLADAALVASYRSALAHAFRDEVDDASPRIVCLSNEHCSSRLLADAEIRRLARLIADHCDRVTVVIYLRAQGDALLSAYSTYVKTGGVHPFAAPSAAEIARRYDYEVILDRWAEVFGARHLDVRLYDRERRGRFDVVGDFLARLDPDLELGALTLERERNPSLGRSTLEFLRRLNGRIPYLVGGQLNPLRGNLHQIVEGFTGDSPFEGDPEIIAGLDAAMSASNERVRQRYLPHLAAPLFPPRPGAAVRPPEPEAVIGIAADLLAHIWEIKQAQVLDLRERLDRSRRLAPGRRSRED